MKEQRVKWVGGCKYGTAEDRVVVITIDQAFVDFDADAPEVFIKSEYPDALK